MVGEERSELGNKKNSKETDPHGQEDVAKDPRITSDCHDIIIYGHLMAINVLDGHSRHLMAQWLLNCH